MKDILLPARPRFYDLCVIYKLDYQTLLDIAERAGVSSSVIDAMFTGDPVVRVHAEKVLAVFSQTMGHTWTMEGVKVPVITPERLVHHV